jgi:protein-S-isoprenylcysteine O-methyltransferase Ste14
MDKIIIFVVLSIPITIISWRTLFNVKKHGFYRFFSWECIAWLFASDYKYWFVNPFSAWQIISWILLVIAIYLVLAGAITMKKKGKASQARDEKNLYGFEKTTELIDTGIFKYIRHPLYSSLIYLTWGIFMKNPSFQLLIIAILSTAFLVITSLYDENECIAYFGQDYSEYMKRSKRFIPFLF